MDKMKIILFLLLFISLSCESIAATVTVGWDVNTDAEYYVVYRKKSGETDDMYVIIANNVTATQASIIVSDDNQIYDYTVKAFNSCGNSSDFSDPVSYNAYVDNTMQKVTQLKIGG